MARPPSKKTVRGKVKKALEDALKAKNLTGQIYRSRIQQYMDFYDTSTYLNGRLNTLKKAKNRDDKLILSIIAEMRRVDNQMLELEKYFGFDPAEPDSDADEPL